MGLGFLPGGQDSNATGISADGSVVVGVSDSSSNHLVDSPYRWTASTGMVGLDPSFGQVSGVSADGSVVVGNNLVGAYRWTSGTGFVNLGQPPGGTTTMATAVSSDGSTVVGFGNNGGFDGQLALDEAFRWTSSSGVTSLGFTPGSIQTLAYGVSADGTVVVGDAASGLAALPGFLWTPSIGITSIGVLPGATFSSPRGVSADGSVVVGFSDTPGTGTEGQAFRWTRAGGMVGLGFLPGGGATEALAVSADGSMVVGYSDGANGNPGLVPMIWDAKHGMRLLQQVLTDDGLNLSGWVLAEATGVSADGNTIVGFGIDPGGNTEAWIATIPEPGTGVLLITGVLGLAIKRRVTA